MASSSRKSSIGSSRRLSQKAHIPYRGGNPEVGRKTGIAVRHVQRKSDGFEPFEDVVGQADEKTPPNVKGRKQKKTPKRLSVVEDDPENGEMSMELDDNTPLSYFKNIRQVGSPSKSNHVGTLSRPALRPSIIDYDKVPSPRPMNKRFSIAHSPIGRPSGLSKSISARDLEPDPPDSHEDYGDLGGTGDNFDRFSLPASPDGHHTSFTEIDRAQEDGSSDEMDDEPRAMAASRKDKGKGRAVRQESVEEDQVEEQIADGLEEVDQQEDDEEEQEEAEQPSKKRSRTEDKPKRPPKARKDLPPRSPTPEGIRRSKRHRYGRLEWWRLERVVYGRRDSGNILVPHIKEIIRIPKEPPVPLGSKNKRKWGTRSKSRAPEELAVVLNPEEGWDDETEQQAVVYDFVTGQEVMRRVAYTARMVHPKGAANAQWLFEKIFGDGDFIAAGQLIIPPKGRKPSKLSKDNTYIFYIIEGAVNLRIHETSLILCTGGMFMVPRGNQYFIENISDRDAKLFFTQARKTWSEDDLAKANERMLPPSLPNGHAHVRGRVSSAGPTGEVNSSHAPQVQRASTTRL